jgi:hypothetical protein
MHGYLAGVSLRSFAVGNRRLITGAKKMLRKSEPDPCQHPEHKKPQHAEHCSAHPAPKTAAAGTSLKERAAKRAQEWGPWLGGAAIIVYVWHHQITRWVPVFLTTFVTLWVLAALVAGQERPADATAGAPAAPTDASHEADDDQDDEIQDAPADATLYALIRHVAGLTKQGTAAHLSQVLEQGEKRGLLGGWEVADLSDHLTSLGVPVVEKKKLTVGGRDYTRMAVLLTALPEADPATVPAVARGAA